MTYLDRVPGIKRRGLRPDMPSRMRTGFAGRSDIVYLIVAPKLAQWAALDRNMDRSKDWVLLKVTGLDPELITGDDDYSEDPIESIKWAGTFGYRGHVTPEMISVYTRARGNRQRRHDEFDSLNELRASPSGRGVAVPAHAPGKYQQDYPILPIPFGIDGARGMPSTEFSVNASRLMQNVMSPDDIAQAKATHGNAPYDVERTYSYSSVPLTSMGHRAAGDVAWALSDDDDDDEERALESLRRYIRLTVDEVHDRDPVGDEEETDESSGAGAVAGYTAPLGTAPKVPGAKKKRQPAWSVVGRAWGNAKRI